MYNIQHAVVVPKHIKETLDRDLYQSWMLYYQRGHYVKQSTSEHPFVFAETVDEILAIIKDKDTEYLILTWFGMYSSDFWHVHDLCIDNIERQKRVESFAQGNWSVLSDNNKNTIQMVNLKEWKKQGCPAYADFSKQSKKINKRIVEKLLDSKAIENPRAWNEELLHFTQLPIIQTNITDLLTKLITTRNPRHANTHDKGVFFLYNTEAICTDKERLGTVQGAINTVIGPCSMFKAFILGSKYLNAVDNYLHFDIFDRNLQWKKLITENWNGTKKGLVKTLELCHDDGDGDFSFWSNGSQNIIDKQWNVLIEELGSAEKIEAAWKIYQTKNHEYALSNMLFDDTEIINCLENFNITGIYHAIGDIPGFRSNALQFGLQQINSLTRTHLKRVAKVNQNVYVDIKVPASDLQKFKKYDEIIEDLDNDYEEFSFERYSE